MGGERTTEMKEGKTHGERGNGGAQSVTFCPRTWGGERFTQRVTKAVDPQSTSVNNWINRVRRGGVSKRKTNKN